ncbi:MAG: type I methionyl aminopeptidase [Saprospiraceae bacterium]|nr:type I methionyl aminopeptidase [Saprospiraceae bacterium]
MIFYKTDEEIELMRLSNLLVSQTHAHVAAMIRPGITGAELDQEAETFIRDHGAVPAFKGYNGFPATLCISINEQVVHGIPSRQEFKEGDVISLDCGVQHNDFFGDSAFTYAIGDPGEEVMRLLRVTNTSLYVGIEQAVAGNRLGDIGFAIQEYVERQHGFGVVRELVGHGIGRHLHEEPEVPNYGKRGRGIMLKEGLVIAIEPMVNRGKKAVKQAADGWTVISRDGTTSAHFEHSIAIRKGKADILSDHSIIETVVQKNPNLMEIGILSEAFSA